MKRKRVTISAPAARAADAGEVESVSAYFAGPPAREPDWVEAREALDAMLSEAGGLTDADRAWAGAVLGIGDEG